MWQDVKNFWIVIEITVYLKPVWFLWNSAAFSHHASPYPVFWQVQPLNKAVIQSHSCNPLPSFSSVLRNTLSSPFLFCPLPNGSSLIAHQLPLTNVFQCASPIQQVGLLFEFPFLCISSETCFLFLLKCGNRDFPARYVLIQLNKGCTNPQPKRCLKCLACRQSHAYEINSSVNNRNAVLWKFLKYLNDFSARARMGKCKKPSKSKENFEKLF